MSGTLKAVLCERQLLLERNTGHSLSLRYDQIVRMRHRQLPLIQPWLLITGLLLVISAGRIISGSLSYWVGALGGSIILLWIIGRKPVLTIDTQNGDSHSLFGLDITLLKIRIIIERVQDGMSLKNAKEGLEELERKEQIYPTAGLIEAQNITGNNSLTESIEDSLSMSHTNDSIEDEIILDAEIESESDEKQMIIGEHPAIERARRATQEIRNQRYQNEAHQGIPDTRDENSWWDEKPTQVAQEPKFEINNQQSAYGAARYSPNQFDTVPSQEQQSNIEMDMGFDFSMFDDPEPTQTTMHQTSSPSIQTNTQYMDNDYGQTNTDYRQSNNYDQAQYSNNNYSQYNNNNYSNEESFLPSFPSTEIEHTILSPKFVESIDNESSDTKKEILSTEKSLTAQARRTEEEQRKYDLESANMNSLNNAQRLKLGRDSTFRRLKVRENGVQKRSQYELVRDILVNSLHRITNVSKNILKRKEGATSKKQLENNHSKTIDILRVQAKHSKQAEIAEAVRKLTKGNEELTQEEIQIIATTLEKGAGDGIIDSEMSEVPIAFEAMKSTSKVKAEMDNIPGIKRLE